MLKCKMMAINMPFREQKYDEDGNIMFDKHGNPVKHTVMRVVRHNAMYIPR